MPEHYTIEGQRPTVAIDGAGLPKPAVEITFRWGNNFLGSITVETNGATKEGTKKKIEDYIAKFNLDDG